MKLELKKETLKVLTDQETEQVAAGLARTMSCYCSPSPAPNCPTPTGTECGPTYLAECGTATVECPPATSDCASISGDCCPDG